MDKTKVTNYQEGIEEWYNRMMKQFEEDSKTHDFSLPEEWDKDFRRAMGLDS